MRREVVQSLCEGACELGLLRGLSSSPRASQQPIQNNCILGADQFFKFVLAARKVTQTEHPGRGGIDRRYPIIAVEGNHSGRERFQNRLNVISPLFKR